MADITKIQPMGDSTQYTLGARYLTTARTLTIGGTGKTFDGTANVSWSKAEILGSSSSANFYRGDQSWSNTLDGNFYANTIVATNTTTNGSQFGMRFSDKNNSMYGLIWTSRSANKGGFISFRQYAENSSGTLSGYMENYRFPDVAVNLTSNPTYYILTSKNYNDYAPTKTGGGASGTWGISITGNAATATNADKVDNYHAADLWRKDGATWNPGANISLSATANSQEWSFDMYRNGYTGTCWHVWDSSLGSMLRVTPDNGRVNAPYGFIGNLSGCLTNFNHSVSLSASTWGASNPWNSGSRTLVWGQRGLLSSASSDTADLVLYYGTHGSAGGAGWFMSIDGGINSLVGIYTAVWNDFAEYRVSDDNEPGRVIAPASDGKNHYTTKRLQPASRIVSDTFGQSVGYCDEARTPIGVAGRVLAYTYQDRNKYKIGDAVCAAPNGTVDRMKWWEKIFYPDRILGIVNEIPQYEEWIRNISDEDDNGNLIPNKKKTLRTPVKGRIWIDIK